MPSRRSTRSITMSSTPREFSRRWLSQNLLDHPAIDVGQPEVAAGVAEGQPLVVEAQQVQDRGVQIVDVYLVLHGSEAEVVGSAVGHAAFHAAASQPHGETPVVVVAAGSAFRGRSAAELAA